MSASLVGSEMCIRDRARASQLARKSQPEEAAVLAPPPRTPLLLAGGDTCLLYTSDAADDM
eukprot:901511-Alexandrium_andersonii.AAC.1